MQHHEKTTRHQQKYLRTIKVTRPPRHKLILVEDVDHTLILLILKDKNIAQHGKSNVTSVGLWDTMQKSASETNHPTQLENSETKIKMTVNQISTS